MRRTGSATGYRCDSADGNAKIYQYFKETSARRPADFLDCETAGHEGIRRQRCHIFSDLLDFPRTGIPIRVMARRMKLYALPLVEPVYDHSERQRRKMLRPTFGAYDGKSESRLFSHGARPPAKHVKKSPASIYREMGTLEFGRSGRRTRR
jgi:hypothetical protein